jgi:hypothetical protein
MNDTFPTYQFSIFDKNDGDAQWVVRGNDWKAFLMDVEAIKGQVKVNLDKDPIMATTANVETHPCKTCGANTNFKSGINKAGKPYAGYFCVNNKDHVNWISTK